MKIFDQGILQVNCAAKVFDVMHEPSYFHYLAIFVLLLPFVLQ